ncbi:ACT domain-containing protein [Acetobacterium woodii]|uniref:Phenylalanine biosynthesis protein PheB n=1 Tax=Acetobacterium woodii (strain ATCC 29683 / DSM 1030 / JCM 2381 / KCTC 1655 / WB1) TaxID=931626 RepID=H6LGF1_ACEWD|nr:ACT domain-containing protein [Acetobacterium woodii]AFA47087.1 phenylalanine biosynthesis protein PheB [Acetobacterium woodii DSM 1030]
MIKDYLIVNKKILPDYYSKVVEARSLMESAQCKSVSDAVKKVGISRSTYYKYKDYIFTPSENYGRKFTLSFKLDDRQGILSKILNILRDHQTSIITIHQDIPINQAAVVIVTLDGKNLLISIDELMNMLDELDGVHGVQLIAME